MHVVSVTDIDIVFVFVVDVVVVIVVVIVIGIGCNAKNAIALCWDRGIDFQIISFCFQPVVAGQRNFAVFPRPAGIGCIFSFDDFFIVL